MEKKDEKTKEPHLITPRPPEVTPVGDLTGFEAIMDDTKLATREKEE